MGYTKWNCKYHIVFAPKYRRKIFYGEKREEIGKILRELCGWKGVQIIEGHMMPDYAHLLASIPPKMNISGFMGYLKGKSAMIFGRHSNLKYKFGNRNFWATGYYVSTVGLNEATIAKYIREQEKADHIMDKLTTKEYTDLFKGSPAKQSMYKWLEQSESQRRLGAGFALNPYRTFSSHPFSGCS